jgi:hypothetical protein
MNSREKYTKCWNRTRKKIRLEFRAEGRTVKQVEEMIGSIKLKRLQKECKNWKGKT